MSTQDLFLKAFGGKDAEANAIGPQTDPSARTDYFLAAFAAEPKQLPKPNYKSWRLNATKARGLDFAELMELDRLQKEEVHYSELPTWILEGGYVLPTQEEKARQRQLEKETGLNTVERAQLFDAFKAEVGALAMMAEKESLRGSIFLDEYLQKAFERFGEADVMDQLKSDYPQAAQYLVAHIQTKRAEAAQAQAMLDAETKQQDVAAEIRAAQEAIAAMADNPLVVDAQIRGIEVAE